MGSVGTAILGGAAQGMAGSFNIMDPSGSRAYGRQRHERRMGQAFSERMSNTAMQRRTTDLEKSGLNRVLALGDPASSPQSSGGNVGQADGEASFDALKMLQAALTSESAKKLKEETKGVKIDNVIKSHQIPGAKLKGGFIEAINKRATQFKRMRQSAKDKSNSEEQRIRQRNIKQHMYKGKKPFPVQYLGK